MNIKMDFVTDWQDFMINEIASKGLQYSSNIKKDLLLIRYFAYLRKIGGETPAPRSVYKAKEFLCPPEHIAGLEKLIDVLQNGQDISPYLSTKIDDISKVDEMFNDWGVLHLHLGDRPYPRDSRFIDRTGPLLFLYLMPRDAYLINIYEHGDWTDKTILQTVQDNWPELIEPYVMKGALRLEYQCTEEEHAALRKAGISVLIELKDNKGDTIVIVPPGLGIATSKDSIKDVQTYNAQINSIRKIERIIREKPAEFFQPAFDGNVPDPMELKLVYQNEKWSIAEQSTGVVFNLLEG